MAKFFNELDENQTAFIQQQKMFFVASASSSGRIQLSPKGLDSFRILDNKSVAYLDLTGSGNEAAAHIKNDGRLTIMFCSFENNPLIIRLYGKGRVILPGREDWEKFFPLFEPLKGYRQIIHLSIESLQTSCGYGVPLYDYAGDRDTIIRWAEKTGESGLVDYRRQNNKKSIDGFPADVL